MNKGLGLIQRQQPEFINDFPTGNICIGVTEEELAELKKELERLEEIDDILNTGGGIWAEGGFVSNQLKAFEIIKKKQVNIQQLMICFSLKEYNKYIFEQYKYCSEEAQEIILTQEEYDLLKEVLI